MADALKRSGWDLLIGTCADSTGSSHLGTCTFTKEEAAVLNLGYTDGDGTQELLLWIFDDCGRADPPSD